MQLFAVVYAASEPELGIAHAVALSYVVVWAVARYTKLSHGARDAVLTPLFVTHSSPSQTYDPWRSAATRAAAFPPQVLS